MRGWLNLPPWTCSQNSPNFRSIAVMAPPKATMSSSMTAGIICMRITREISPTRDAGGGSSFLKASFSSRPLWFSSMPGRPMTNSQSSGTSERKRMGGMTSLRATLRPPSTMKPPCLKA